MPNKHTTDNNYRYAFQGQEKDGETDMEAFELRLWDGRLGRWLTVDPYHEFHSPYLGMGNNPISLTDPDGGSSDSPNDEWKYDAKTGNLTWLSPLGGSEEQIIHVYNGNKFVDFQVIDGDDFFIYNTRNSVSISNVDLELPSTYNISTKNWMKDDDSFFEYTPADLRKRSELKSLGGIIWDVIKDRESKGKASLISISSSYEQYVAKWGTDSAFWYGLDGTESGAGLWTNDAVGTVSLVSPGEVNLFKNNLMPKRKGPINVKFKPLNMNQIRKLARIKIQGLHGKSIKAYARQRQSFKKQ